MTDELRSGGTDPQSGLEEVASPGATGSRPRARRRGGWLSAGHRPQRLRRSQLGVVDIAASTMANIAPAMTAKSHDCAKCQDVTKEVTVSSSKGAYQKTALVAEHTCPTCDTRIKTEGLGKAAHNVAVHTCASGTTPSCCQ